MIVIWEKFVIKFGQILEIYLKIVKVFKKMLIKTWKNLTKIWNFPAIDSLSSKIFVFGGNDLSVPPFPESRYFICYFRNLGGGGKTHDKIIF